MKHWTLKRKASFWIHTGIVTVPFTFSTVSAGVFWFSLFQDYFIAGAIVTVVDVLALLGLILYITRIHSPFQALRHALPFVSIVPLGLELYGVLEPNGPWIAGAVTILVTAIMVAVAALCFHTIEQLFIPPIDAAREKAEQDVASLERSLAQFHVVNEAVEAFARQRYASSTPQLTVVESAATVTPLSKTARVEQMALEAGVSVSTMWRRVQRGDVKLED